MTFYVIDFLSNAILEKLFNRSKHHGNEFEYKIILIVKSAIIMHFKIYFTHKI